MRRTRGFTLVELLVVMAIIALLIGVLVPSLSAARQVARGGECLANLHNLGVAMRMYHNDNAGYFWPAARWDHPEPGVNTYFWGSATDPVDPDASPFMRYTGGRLEALWCPAMKWDSYVPQGGVDEATTEYGYNGWCLDPPYWGRNDQDGNPMPRKRIAQIRRPAELFVFADAAMAWAPGGVTILQNSTSLDPVRFPWGANETPTTHFRHRGRAQAVSVDGHAGAYEPAEGVTTGDETVPIGFVSAENTPHYDQ